MSEFKGWLKIRGENEFKMKFWRIEDIEIRAYQRRT
jgi:hypothetical protein